MAADEFYEQNYFLRALRGDFPIVKELPSFRIVQRYIQEHSHRVLLSEFHSNNSLFWDRKFVVGHYSCPIEAGNRLHRFMNALFIAIASNRTFLWEYYDASACLRNDLSPGFFVADWCRKLDNVTDCDRVLIRHKWMPSFRYWKTNAPQLGLPSEGDLIEGDPNIAYNGPYDTQNTSKLYRMGKQMEAKFLFHFRPSEGPVEIPRIVSSGANLWRTTNLTSLDFVFLYGMLFEACFTFRQHLLPSPKDRFVAKPNTTTLYLHSRHPGPRYDDGSYIVGEEKCLIKMLEKHYSINNGTNNKKRCQIVLMSDRQITLDLLTNLTRDRFHCEPIVASHQEYSGAEDSGEHGVFRGAGYFQDWALARNARSGGIAFHRYRRPVLRTSSMLIQESIEFRRTLEATSLKEMPPFSVCGHYKWRGPAVLR